MYLNEHIKEAILEQLGPDAEGLQCKLLLRKKSLFKVQLCLGAQIYYTKQHVRLDFKENSEVNFLYSTKKSYYELPIKAPVPRVRAYVVMEK